MDGNAEKINGFNSAISFLNKRDLIQTSDLLQIDKDLREILAANNKFEDAKPQVNIYCKDYADLILVQQNANLKNVDDKDFHDLVHICAECILLNCIHDEIFQLVSNYGNREDEKVFRLCTEFCHIGVTAEQFGAPENYAIPLIAAIVELASLDNHKSPLDKLNCLCGAYDLIFAELKCALIDVISKTTDSTIPIIDNLDVVPILMTVIVRAKPVHMYSNLLLIEHFCNAIKFDRDLRSVFLMFKTAVDKLLDFNRESLNPKSDKVCRDLDLHKLIIMSGNNKLLQDIDEDDDDNETLTTLQLQTQRVIDLVTASTFKTANK